MGNTPVTRHFFRQIAQIPNRHRIHETTCGAGFHVYRNNSRKAKLAAKRMDR
jgi:hypothetical protein